MNDTDKAPFVFALLLGMTVALGPLAIDTYIPAFPEMAGDLGVSVHEISLSISIYVFFLAIGQLVAGPLADKFGRKIVMLTGLGMFAVSSLLISLVQSLEWLLVLRAVQAFVAGWAMVCVPAMVRDRLSGQAAAKLFSLIGLIMIIAPALAPNIGSVLLLQFGWPSIFFFLGTYTLLVMVLLKWKMFNSDYHYQPATEVLSVLQRYQQVLHTRRALPFIFLGAFSFSVMLIFITHASFLYQENFGVGPSVFALLFAANIVMMIGMNLLNRRLLSYFMPETILAWGVALQFTGTIMLLLVSYFYPSLWWFLPGMIITVGSMGIIMPNIQASYMEYFPENGGTAAAIFGAAQFSIAGSISALTALLPETVIAIVMAQFACGIACIMLLWGQRKTAAKEATNCG